MYHVITMLHYQSRDVEDGGINGHVLELAGRRGAGTLREGGDDYVGCATDLAPDAGDWDIFTDAERWN